MLAISAAAPVLEVDAGEEEVDVGPVAEAELELGLEVELVFGDTTPPWTVAGVVLFEVLAAADS